MPRSTNPADAALLERRLYTVRQTSQLLGMSMGWVLEQASTGRLPSLRVGQRVMLHREEVDAIVPPIGTRCVMARNKPKAPADGQ